MAGHFNSLVPNTDPSPPSVEQPAIRQPSLALTAVAAIVLSAMVLIGMFWPSSSLEVKFLLWIGESLGTSLDDIMHAMDVVGDVGTMSIALLVLAVLVSFRRGFRPAAAVLVTGVAALLVNVGLKVLSLDRVPDSGWQRWIPATPFPAVTPCCLPSLFCWHTSCGHGSAGADRWP